MIILKCKKEKKYVSIFVTSNLNYWDLVCNLIAWDFFFDTIQYYRKSFYKDYSGHITSRQATFKPVVYYVNCTTCVGTRIKRAKANFHNKSGSSLVYNKYDNYRTFTVSIELSLFPNYF